MYFNEDQYWENLRESMESNRRSGEHYQDIICNNCNSTIATIDSIYSDSYTFIYPDYFCERCVNSMMHELPKNIENTECCECGKKLVDGESGTNKSEYYYKIDNHFYCVDCVDAATDQTVNIDRSEFIFEPDFEED